MDMDAANSNEDDENSPLMVDEECNRKSSWHPRFEAFSPYSPPGSTSTATSTKSSALRIVARRSLVARLTKDIVDTYRACNPKFSYSEVSKPKRFLTSPSNGVLNDGHDNANSDLILSVNFVLVNESQQRYIVKDMLGQGTFGQVAKCWISETNSYVAVKVIKNQPAYYHQALVEVSILTMLNQRFDPEDKHHIVRILDYFVFQQHLCISFEMLGSNLYELIKMNQFRGLSLSIVQMFSKQILHALIIMKDAGIIHCDLKPENILLSTNVKPPEIKVIDFGSACTENRTVYSYIQSRYYRSPEVLLGHPYTTAIDMWSFGCIIAELFLGLPLFPGASEFDLMKRMIEILGAQPPDYMLKASKSTSKFFKCVGGLHCVEDEDIDRTKTPYQLLTESPYQLLTEEEYEVRELKKPVIGKQYFNYVRLEDIVVNYPYRKNLTKEEINKESLTRLALIDFLRGVIEFDPVKRWSPSQAAGHPFLTGEPYLCPYVPPSETPRISVAQNVIVDHNPGGGHWFQAGLSPQISDGNRYLIHNGLYFPVAPFSLASSYGSYGSHGSYKDCNLGSSHGSYGDGMYNNLCSIGPPGLNILQTHIGSGFGANQATKHRASQIPHGPTYGGSSVGKFGAMSLGASPSQFTPPTSQLQISSGSPGKYGPTSPARNNLHGSPLSKVSAVGHYNQRRSWGYSNASHMQPHENMSFQNRHGSYTDGSGFNHPENNSFGHGSPHNFQLASSVPGWMQGCGNYAPGLSSSLTIHQNYSGAAPLASHLPASSTTEAFLENIEYTSQPNPGDWDPNYSDDLLLQDDDPGTAALSSGIFNGLHLSKASDSTIVTANAADRRIFNASNQIQRLCGNNSSNRRTNTFQTYCHGEGNSSPINDKHNARNILKHPHHMPHYLQSSPSRFSQQPFQQMYYTQGALATSDCDQTNKLPFASYCNTQGLHSPQLNMFANGVSCGHRTNHHPTSSLPPPHSRKDYERIA